MQGSGQLNLWFSSVLLFNFKESHHSKGAQNETKWTLTIHLVSFFTLLGSIWNAQVNLRVSGHFHSALIYKQA